LAGVSAPARGAPLSCTLHDSGVAFEVPVLVRVTTQVFPPTLHTTCVAWTVAELVNDPNRPNTNPAMAMAAMRVMAMRMTVASTGEMAFLFFL